MKYWERWVGDWKRKTAHLSAEAKGIYGELLDYIYSTQNQLPLDPEEIYRLAGARTSSECKSTDRVLREFFIKGEQGYVNERALEEITRRESYVEAQRGRANMRWHQPRPDLKGNGEDKTALENLPLKTGDYFAVTAELVKELDPLYPAVDIPTTLREMKGWLVGNPERRKTKRGIRKFICGWLQREQEKHGS